MVSVVLKANLFSLIYLMFIFKYVMSVEKVQLLDRLVVYMSLCFVAQYFLYMSNLTAATSPAKYPPNVKLWDKTKKNQVYYFPLFFKHKLFQDLSFSTLVGVGVQPS